MHGQERRQLLDAPDALGLCVVDTGAVRGDQELPVLGDLEPGGLRHGLRGERHRLRDAVELVVPHHLPDGLLLGRREHVAADLDQLLERRVPDALVDEDVAVGRTPGPEVRRLGPHGVVGGLVQILRGRLVPDHRGVAGADGVGRRARHVGAAHDALSAGRDDQIALGHQGLREAPVDLALVAQDLDQILGGADPPQPFAHQLDRLAAGLQRQGMRREDDGVAGLDGVDGVAGRRQVGVGRRDDAGDHADGLRT